MICCIRLMNPLLMMTIFEKNWWSVSVGEKKKKNFNFYCKKNYNASKGFNRNFRNHRKFWTIFFFLTTTIFFILNSHWVQTFFMNRQTATIVQKKNTRQLFINSNFFLVQNIAVKNFWNYKNKMLWKNLKCFFFFFF